ncbi:MAG: hypothetical protein JST10_06395 [Bacteroidetes bacterium]|nr:hypothetical protein [Bacteroidota bacterium]
MELTGEYYLQDVQEMASGFLLKEDHTFQFFFSYGALDRYGSGRWEARNDMILFNSIQTPGDAFSLVNSRKEEHPFIQVMLEGNDPLTNAYTYVSLKDGKEDSWENMSQRGDIQFPLQETTRISLMVEFCSDRKIIIPVNAAHNSFTFRINPSVAEVFFSDFALLQIPEGLKGRHPLMEGNSFVYAK